METNALYNARGLPPVVDQGAVNNCVALSVCAGYFHRFGLEFDPNWLHGRRRSPNTTIEAALLTCAEEGNVPVQADSLPPMADYGAVPWVKARMSRLLKAAAGYKIAGFERVLDLPQLQEAFLKGRYVVFSVGVTQRTVDERGVFRPDCGSGLGYSHAMSAWGIARGLVWVQNSWGTGWGQNGRCWMEPADLFKGGDCWAFWFFEDGKGENMRETKYGANIPDGKAAVLRAEPTSDGEQVGTLANGEQVTALATDGDRTLVALGACGWVQTKYLTDTAPEPQNPDLGPEPEDEDAKLQWYLHKWGFGPLVGAIDGIVGTKTKAATKQFQAAMGLAVDGIAGQNTWAALRGEVIEPRITEKQMECTCGKYCDGMPNPCTAGVRILIERIWRELEKKYPGVVLYISNSETPAPDGAVAGGQRCQEWNKIRGGAEKSQHLTGTAADIYGKADGVTDSALRQEIEDIALDMNTKGGVGYGARYIVHVDIRGYKARWEY